MSLEDQKAFSITENSVKLEDGHYTVAIPFREKPPSLPNNRVVAEKRLAGLGRKLENNPALKDAYSESIEALLQKGHAETVTPEDEEPKAAWYVPHHAVLNPCKRQVRVVFDCAATHKGTSLNDQVLTGRGLTSALLGIMLRFREHRVAVSADIEGMFLQVKVLGKDRDRLRFLWWPGGDTKVSPETYRITSHLVGGTWSTSISAYTLRKKQFSGL